MEITTELEKRIDTVFRAYYCDTCEGTAIVGQSPSFPEGSRCEDCCGSGLANCGETILDLQDNLKYTLNRYIYDFQIKKAKQSQLTINPTKTGEK